MNYSFHPAANLFPLLSDNELKTLAKDIENNGLKQPIILFDNQILDGRNRYKACKIAGIDPSFKEIKNANPWEYAWSLNAERRHLEAGVKACLRLEMEDHSSEWKEQQEKQKEEANAARSAAAKGNKNASKNSGGTTLSTTVSEKKTKVHETRKARAKSAGVSEGTMSKAEYLKENHKDLFDLVCNGKMSLDKAKKEATKRDRETALSEARKKITEDKKNSIKDVCDIRHCSFAELLKVVKPDAIITDPPYPKEYVHIYEELAKLSKDIPIVAVMCGQSYLPEIIAMMTKHLKYRWMFCYFTPGGQAVQQWQSKINTFWKPILIFGESAEWSGDVVKSETNDKRFHEWGQSESGMMELVKKLTKPGDLICDPFIGGGTTAVVSLMLGRRFVGCDTDIDCVNKSLERCEVQCA
jgi:site-specific DNA-methyltransferase (adenine-specific)